MRRFTIDLHGPLHGVDYGGEGRLVLLVHGLGGSSINWADVGEPLTAHGRVIAPDLPGFGRTPPAGRSSAISDQAELLADLLKTMSDAPAIVIGNSMGGIISMLLAARHPDLVERLVLVNPAAPSWTPDTINPVWAAMLGVYLVPGFSTAVLKAIQRRGTAERRTAESMDMIAADGGRVSDRMKRLHADVARERETMPWIYDSYLTAYRSVMRHMFPQSKYDRMVHRIMAPTLLMHGMVDPIVPFSAAARLADQRPDWTFVPLEDTGHIPMLESPETFLKLVDEFLGVPTAQY